MSIIKFFCAIYKFFRSLPSKLAVAVIDVYDNFDERMLSMFEIAKGIG